MKTRNYASRVLGIALAAMVIVVIGMGMTSCTDSNSQFEQDKKGLTPDPTPSPDPDREVSLNPTFICKVDGNRFDHTMGLEIAITAKGSDTPETILKSGEIKSYGVLSLSADTIRVSEDAEKPYQVGETIFNKARTKAQFTISDSRILTLDFASEHKYATWMGTSYEFIYDSLSSARLISVEFEEPALTRAGASVPTKYVKNTWATKYFVEVTTNHYWNGGNLLGSDVDTLLVRGITLEMADNNAKKSKTGYGTKIIDDNLLKDSVIITTTWDDGHKENQVYNNVRERWIKNLPYREVIVADFSNQNCAPSFSMRKGDERPVRSDANWEVNGRQDQITKMVSVSDKTEEVSYDCYGQKATFTLGTISHTFDYIEWEIGNYADDFTASLISTKSGYDQLNYKNEIRTSYLGYVKFLSEDIAWFKKSVTINGYDVVNAKRVDYTTYTLVSLDKIAIYSDGTNKKVGSYSAELPISVNPLTNWVINTDEFGTYTSNEFSGTQTSKSAKTAEKFFSYNQFGYTYSNTVSGQTNKLAVSVPNDITFNDGDVKYTFKNSDLKVAKAKDNTAKAGETDELITYKYTCVAGVTFGETAQEVTLPGTINVTKDNGPHIHGKVKAVYFTTTPNENRSFYKSVCVLEFEDGFRSVGMTENGANEFNFNMSSWKYVNSAVYTGGNWIPAIAEDNTGAKCMIWKDENGAAKRTLDFITATRDSWNNGHNTVFDGRRSASISKSGYSVTLYLNGNAGQTLKF